jgi:O-antigen/teichoic acid export membrane protein
MEKTEEFSISKSFSNSTIYFFTSVLQKALSFFLLPIYTIYLGTEDYGLVSLILSFFGVITLLITLALNGSVSRYYFIYKNDLEKQKQFIGTIIIGVIINSLIWFVLLISFKNIITSIFLKNINFYPYIFVALLSTVTAPVFLIYQSILQIKQKATTYAVNSLSFFIFAITLNIIFIVINNMGALGMLLAGSLPNILFSFYAVYSLIRKKHILLVFRLNYLKEALNYSIPLIPHVLSGTIADYISRNILYLRTSLGNVGLYNIAFQFGSVLDIILNSLYGALIPLYYNSLDERGEKEQKLIRLFTLLFRLIAITCIFLSLFSKELVYIMTSKPEYYPSWIAIPIIALSILFSFLYSTYGTLLFYNIKGTRYIWIASMSGNIANIFFTVYFTKFFTFVTPAIALVIQRAIMFLLVFFISRKIEPVKFQIRNMIKIILASFFFTSIGISPDLYLKEEEINLYFVEWKIFILFLAMFFLLRKDSSLIYSFVKTNLKKYTKLKK